MIFSCSEDNSTTDQLETEQQQEVEYLKGKPYASKKVSLREIPKVKDYLSSKSGGILFSGNESVSKGSGEVIVNEDEVLIISDSLGRENY